MSTELEGSFVQNVETVFGESDASYDNSMHRENLAGGSGVFANFFEEMAGPQSSDVPVQELSQTHDAFNDQGCFVPDRFVLEDYKNSSGFVDNISNPMHAFYANCTDDDLNIFNQYKHFINRGREATSSIAPYGATSAIDHQALWDGATMMAPSSSCPAPGLMDYVMGDMDNSMCIPYAHRCKPPKVLAKRYLLGDTIGRGSYGKVKDAIDLVTLRRHAVKIISKLGVRKIPGGWTQALLEASVMRRLPPHRHVVSLVTVLRPENPDRLCLVMEHCLGSVHDLQAAGVPSQSDDLAEEDEEDFGAAGGRWPVDGPLNRLAAAPPGSQATPREHARSVLVDRRASKPSRFRVQLPAMATDMKQEAKKWTEALKVRKISNVERGMSRRKQSTAAMQAQQQQQQFRRLPEAQAHAYFLQLIDGLHFLHRNGVIHRDIKPANLLLTPAPGCGLSDAYSVAQFMDAAHSGWLDGNGGQPGFLGRSLSDLLAASRGWLVKLTDFGVSASLSVYSSTDQVNGSQTTPAVQPPEVAKGVQSVFVGSKLDVYSAGVSLYFMLTGRVPFSCQNVLQIFEAIAQGDYIIPGHVSTNAANLIRKMMCKDVKKRFNLEQISRHAWVVNDTPTPLSVPQARRKLKHCLTAPDGHLIHRPDRGVMCWLEPFEFLRRPTREFSPPHVDETGARIFSREELENTEDAEEADDSSSLVAGQKTSGSLTEIAPISVLERLKLFHALSENPDPQIVATFTDRSSSFTGLEPQLTRLGIYSGPERSDLSVTPQTDMFHAYPRYMSPMDNENLRDELTLPGDVRPHGLTISLPQGFSGHPTIYCEPPDCPANIPVSPALSPSQTADTRSAALAALLHTDGTIRAASFSGNTNTPDIAQPSTGFEPSNQRTWHSGFRLGSKPMNLSQLTSTRLRTDDQSIEADDLTDSESGFYLPDSDEGELDVSTSHRPPGSTKKSTTRCKPPQRRLTHWFSVSFSSLRHRLRNFGRSRSRATTADDGGGGGGHTSSSGGKSIGPSASMQGSIHSEPASKSTSLHKPRSLITRRLSHGTSENRVLRR